MCCLWSGAPCESRDGPGIAPSRRRVAVLLSIRLTHYGPIGGVADSLDEAKGRRGDAFHFAAINDRNPRSAGTRLLHDQPLRLDHATLANELARTRLGQPLWPDGQPPAACRQAASR